MKVGFFQYNVIWRDREANLSYIRSKVKDSTFDLLVLPGLYFVFYNLQYFLIISDCQIFIKYIFA
jgi:hypothetical protein